MRLMAIEMAVPRVACGLLRGDVLPSDAVCTSALLHVLVEVPSMIAVTGSLTSVSVPYGATTSNDAWASYNSPF